MPLFVIGIGSDQPTRDVQLGELLYTLLRLRGIHIWDARPCFLTTAHADEDIDKIMLCFQETVRELQEAGFYPAPMRSAIAAPAGLSGQPPPGARLGKDPSGHPAWFVPDAARPGKFVKVGEAT